MKDLVIKFLEKRRTTTDQELLDLLKQHSFMELIENVEKAKISTDCSFIDDIMVRFGNLLDGIDELANKKNITEWKNVNADNQSAPDAMDKLFEMVRAGYLDFDQKIYYILCLFIMVIALELGTRFSLLELLEEQENI